jgi:hypothetical protein
MLFIGRGFGIVPACFLLLPPANAKVSRSSGSRWLDEERVLCNASRLLHAHRVLCAARWHYLLEVFSCLDEEWVIYTR